MSTAIANPLNANQQSPLTTTTKSQYLANRMNTQASIGTRLSRRYGQLLASEKHYDCIFHISNEQIKCHKLILATASPVFEAMFYGPICEPDKNIEILDISAASFRLLIDYIYTASVDFEQLQLEDAIELYYAAEKYILNELIDECLYAMTQKLRFSNILPALELSVCMNLSSLIEICMTFFTRCCLSDGQFMLYLKSHYCHIPKDCLKQIIAASKEKQPNLLWFVYEWCQQECRELGMKEQHACKQLFEDLQMPNSIALDEENLLKQTQQPQEQNKALVCVERSYLKATRPFVVDWDAPEWKLRLQTKRHILLNGLILNSRLAPASFNLQWYNMPTEYTENLTIQIKTLSGSNMRQQEGEGEAAPAEEVAVHAPYVWQHTVSKERFKFNSNMLLKWNEGVLLTPDVIYELKFTWPREAYGAEYPCSLMSNKLDCIEFLDDESFSGSLVKGLRFMHLL